MTVRVGKALFEDHISIEISPGRWSDTFVFPVVHDRGLPPWDYADVVRMTAVQLLRFRRGASLWVPVSAPGRWYFDELKFALRSFPLALAVTEGRDDDMPEYSDFSPPAPL